MIPKEIIELAIAGGWRYDCSPSIFSNIGDGMQCEYGGANDEWTVWTRKDNGSSLCIPHEQTVLTSAFWQALGKSCGWATERTSGEPFWVDKAHDFYDLILVEIPTLTFWQEIINANK